MVPAAWVVQYVDGLSLVVSLARTSNNQTSTNVPWDEKLLVQKCLVLLKIKKKFTTIYRGI